MINPRELRIGNILNGENGPVIVCALSDYGRVAVKYPNYAPLFAQEAKEMTIEPIPLTEDILLKCGFKSREHPVANGGTLFGYEINGYSHFLLKYNPLNPTYFVEYNFEQPIKFLHQLQNIIFDVYGKELNVQL